MLTLKDIENEAAFDEICKKSEELKKIKTNKGYFFGQHPLVQKSPTATAIY